MKFSIKTISIIVVVVGLLTTACRDESLSPVPDWNYVLHGFGQIKSDSPVNFIFGNEDSKIDFDLAWVSIDNQGTAESMDVFVSWSEKYVDDDGNNQTANHGRRQLMTITGLGANRESRDFSISVADVKSLFSDVTFNYGDGPVSVYSNARKPERSSNTFTDDDAFVVSWAITAADGKYFDSWTSSVCGDFTGANCTIPFFVVCESDLEGTYALTSVAQGPWGCTDTYTGTSRWEKLSGASYQVYTTDLGGNELADFSFGSFYPCYGADQGALPNGSLVLNDVCNSLSYTGASQWGEIYSFNSVSVSDDGTDLIIDWINDYGEGGLATFSRTDGSTWPALTK